MSKSEGQVLDFEKICRLCLLEKRSMSAIFSKKKSDKKVPLPVRIMSCASLELYEGDGLPASICSKCLLSVNQSYAFREQCEQADTTLRQYAQRMNEANEEASTNRELRERIGNDSLERIADNGNKNEEDKEVGLEDGDNKLDLRICLKRKVDVKSRCFLNIGKVAMISAEGGLKSSVGEKANVCQEEPVRKKRPKVTKVSLERVQSCKKVKKKSEVIETSNDVVTDGCVGVLEESKDAGRRFDVSESMQKEVQKHREKECTEVREEKAMGNCENYDHPALKALSNEKVENVIVIADVDAINAKFPSDLEDEDGDNAAPTSSEDDFPTKVMEQNWFRKKRQTKNDLKLFKSNKKTSKGDDTSKSNFTNRKHLELLQNLMKNKNIIVQRRAASDSGELTLGKTFSVKNHEFKGFRKKRGMSFPNDFKIAQLWKEWEEVNKRIPSHRKTQMNEIAKPAEVVATCDEAQSDAVRPKKKITTPDVIFEESTEQNKSEEDGKLKWKNGKDTVYCKDCRIFLLRSSYNNHIKFVHEKVRKYLCQTCGYAACTGTILRQHVQAVHVGYSFFCDQCPKKFNLMKRLRKHVELQHSGKPIERNHICQYCGMAFVKPGCLKRHLRSHTQETPYQCQYCQRRFKYRWPKVQHERLHTGEKPYKCSFCEEKFTQNCVRKAHEYKKHGNEEFKPKTRMRKEEIPIPVLKAEKEDSEMSSRGSFRSGSESS